MNTVFKKVLAGFVAIVLAIPMFIGYAQTAEAVTASKTDYDAFIKGRQVYLCNKEPVDSKNGSEYFLTYTVKSVGKQSQRHAIAVTDDCKKDWPFEDGGFMRYSDTQQHLLQEGATYFMKIKVATGGFRYEITRAKGDKVEELILEEYYGKHEEQTKFFGLFFDGNTEAELTRIRCYDANGKDLGVQLANNGVNLNRLVLKTDEWLKKDKKIATSYDVTVTNQYNVGISNLRIPTTKKIYMEYTVESADYLLSEEGVVLSDAPQREAVYEFGVYRYNRFEEKQKQVSLLEVGASYIICMEYTDEGFSHYVQKTKDGKQTRYMFYDEYKPNFDGRAHYYSLFFGNGGKALATFHLTDFKCYDDNKNNLGVQCNKSFVVKSMNGIEDYAGCEAVYYCEKTGDSFALYADQSIKFTKGGVEEQGTYQVSDNVITIKFAATTKTFDYLYRKITDDEGNEYRRLYNYKVTFVTGTDDEIPAQELSNKLGYFVMRPTDPKKDGKKFEGWYTKKGKSFDFDKMVTESITLYAKFEGEKLPIAKVDTASSFWLIGGIALAVIAAGTVTTLVIVRKGKKRES